MVIYNLRNLANITEGEKGGGKTIHGVSRYLISI
jgi:hypothetical protein